MGERRLRLGAEADTLGKTEVTFIDKKLTRREKEFCSLFVGSGDAALAAKRAGYAKDFAVAGEALLCKSEITREIERLVSQRGRLLSSLAAIGYQRLAFGNISDAVSLLFMQNPTGEELAKMDLFLVSEIKRPKEGAMEIKFFDRLKALEKLAEGRTEDSGAKSLFDAIGNGAELSGSDDGD